MQRLERKSNKTKEPFAKQIIFFMRRNTGQLRVAIMPVLHTVAKTFGCERKRAGAVKEC
jgi:hypothetical protein